MATKQTNKPTGKLPNYEIEKNPAFSSPLPIAIGILLAGTLAFGIWYAFLKSSGESVEQAIPLIMADKSPIKSRPDSSAQPEVPHQDKLIYSRVNPAEKQTKVESLLPEAEAPMDTQDFAVEDDQSESTHEVATGYNAYKESDYEPKIIKETIAQDNFPSGMKAAVQEVPVKSAEAVNEKVAEKKPQPVAEVKTEVKQEKPTQARKLKSGFRIQLASMKSPDMAKKEWRRLKGASQGVLDNLNPHFARVDLGASKGIFYRVQVGDFKDKKAADKVCSKLKNTNSKMGCFVIPF